MISQYIEDPFLVFLYQCHRELYPVAALFGYERFKAEYKMEYQAGLARAGTAVWSEWAYSARTKREEDEMD